MIKNDKWIEQQQGLIEPFVNELVSSDSSGRVISYGLSSFGYDIRLSDKELLIFRESPAGGPTDPKKFNKGVLSRALHHLDYDEEGNVISSYFVMPPHSYALGVSMERMSIPDNISVLCIGKSTYARCGIIANLTPIEAGWCGHLTLEFANTSPNSCKLYAGEGIAQLIFFEGESCNTNYGTRKYQDQLHEVTIAR